ASSETGASDAQSSTVTHLQVSQIATSEPAKCSATTCRTQTFSAFSIVIALQAWASSFGFFPSYADSQRRFSTPTLSIRPGQVYASTRPPPTSLSIAVVIGASSVT